MLTVRRKMAALVAIFISFLISGMELVVTLVGSIVATQTVKRHADMQCGMLKLPLKTDQIHSRTANAMQCSLEGMAATASRRQVQQQLPRRKNCGCAIVGAQAIKASGQRNACGLNVPIAQHAHQKMEGSVSFGARA
jgi:hypothetical protein